MSPPVVEQLVVHHVLIAGLLAGVVDDWFGRGFITEAKSMTYSS